MKTSFDIRNVSVFAFRSAVNLYNSGDYRQAMARLFEVLDTETDHWQARLMLGSCYLKTAECAAAQRIFQFIYQKCPDVELVRMAVEGFRSSQSLRGTPVHVPPEFGCVEAINPGSTRVTWLDDRRTQSRSGLSAGPLHGWSAEKLA